MITVMSGGKRVRGQRSPIQADIDISRVGGRAIHVEKLCNLSPRSAKALIAVLFEAGEEGCQKVGVDGEVGVVLREKGMGVERSDIYRSRGAEVYSYSYLFTFLPFIPGTYGGHMIRPIYQADHLRRTDIGDMRAPSAYQVKFSEREEVM